MRQLCIGAVIMQRSGRGKITNRVILNYKEIRKIYPDWLLRELVLRELLLRELLLRELLLLELLLLELLLLELLLRELLLR